MVKMLNTIVLAWLNSTLDQLDWGEFELIFMLSGGSIMKSGSVKPNLANASKNDSTWHVPRGQAANSKMNSAILNCHARVGVVAVFVDYVTFVRPVLVTLAATSQKASEKLDEIDANIKQMDQAICLHYFKCSQEIGEEGMDKEEFQEYIQDQPTILGTVRDSETSLYYSY